MTALTLVLPVVVAALAIGVSVRAWPARKPRYTPDVARSRPQPARWAEFLDAVASSVRSGDSLTVATGVAAQRTGTAPPAIASVDPHARHSHRRPQGRRRAGVPPTGADEAVVLQALEVAARLGGPVASGLQHAADLLRERETTRAEALAHAAQARLSAVVLTLVPVAFAGFGVATSSSYRSAVDGGAGVVLATIGAALNLIGWRWMRRIIGGAAR